MLDKFKDRKGFTLVELLIVIAIITILVTIVLIAIRPETVINQSNDTKTRSELNQIKIALQMYYNENKAYPPAGGWEAALEGPPSYIHEVPSLPGLTYGGGGKDYLLSASLRLALSEEKTA